MRIIWFIHYILTLLYVTVHKDKGQTIFFFRAARAGYKGPRGRPNSY